jgi:zinc transporter
MWIDAHRIISLRRRSLRAVEDVAERVRSGRGPDTAGEFLALLIERVNQRMEPVMRQLDEEADDLEEEVIVAAEPALRRPVTEIRRRAIAFRRYIAPQREAVLEICDCELPFVDEMDMRRLSEAHDHLTRNIEDLDAIRERAQVVKDELHAALSDRLNQNLYFLAIISAVFLPLSFLTGLLGINVGGIPGSENGLAFWYVTGGLTFLGAVMLLVLRRLRWI